MTDHRRGGVLLALFVAGLVACNPNSTRPPQLEPVRDALQVEVHLTRQLATQELADQLLLDSIPVTVVELRDGYLETPWFDAATGVATEAWPLGPEVVRLRGWVDPGAPQHSHMTVELVFRPVADPSSPPRELDQQVSEDNPAALRVGRALTTMAERFPSRVGG